MKSDREGSSERGRLGFASRDGMGSVEGEQVTKEMRRAREET